ncbi:forkhead box protein J1-B-like [Sceloporus undulatus]|uniref:forkhead box protein J1-B-like n=1 Tax=Sceloporus undulatus TaxID=8520 RepID=UPI001C4D7151|nr:forkhead box protein J1-B-like [Sceloporus undulatus]
MSLHNSPAVWLKGQRWWRRQPEPWRSQVDDSLTNLQWLQEFSILTANPEKPIAVSGERVPQRLLQHASEAPSSPPEGDVACMGMPPRMGKPVSSSTSSLPPLLSTQSPIDYRTNSQVKPPYSYATLICMAMRANKEAKLTLSAIYAWITENFCYYRHADPSWQNSIRHNLSLNKCFQKVPRRKDEPGKGGFWQINPLYADLFVDGVFQRRRMPALPLPCAHSTQPVPGRGSLQPDTMPRLPRIQRRLGRSKQPSASAWTGPLLPVAPLERETASALAGDLSWASVLGGTFTGAESNFEDLELTAALDSLAAGEDGGLNHSQTALSENGGSCPAPGLVKELTLCSETWGEEEGEGEEEERAAEPGPGWAFEVGTCFSEVFLAGIQPWES